MNVRDLGGLPLEGGGETRRRVVVRADDVAGLSAAGWRALDEFRPRFARAVSTIATAPGTAVVHCAGGKDRTGLVCALVLRLAGVPLAAVVDDWSLSEQSWAEDSVSWIAQAPDDVERHRRRVFSVAPPEAMHELLAGLEAGRYLEGAGVPGAELDLLRARLRGES